jgi:hypothetical protein
MLVQKIDDLGLMPSLIPKKNKKLMIYFHYHKFKIKSNNSKMKHLTFLFFGKKHLTLIR